MKTTFQSLIISLILGISFINASPIAQAQAPAIAARQQSDSTETYPLLDTSPFDSAPQPLLKTNQAAGQVGSSENVINNQAKRQLLVTHQAVEGVGSSKNVVNNQEGLFGGLES